MSKFSRAADKFINGSIKGVPDLLYKHKSLVVQAITRFSLGSSPSTNIIWEGSV